VQPSSLIFLVLIGIWAAYLLQHWVRRREHLATARSVDRFSDAMRVLERRSPLPDFDLSSPRPRSYAISPARPSRPEVVVKRAYSVRPDAPAAPAVAVTDSAVRPTRVFHLLAGVSARRVRGLSLMVSLLLVLVVSPLAAVSVLPWWSVLAVVGTLMVDFTWLRRVAVSERVARRAGAQAGGSAAGSAGPASRRPTYFDDESEPLAGPEPVVVAQAAGAAEIAEPIESPAWVDPSAWSPVPVPPPTYTLKAKAAAPVAAPVVVTEPGTAAEGWSLDGLIYDCDLDELVEGRSATGA
jgi:hypothetical protein